MTYGDDRMNTKVDWAEIERRVRAGESARAVSRDLTSTGHKISHTAINKHCRRGGWRLPDTSAAISAKRLQDIGASQRTAAEVLGVSPQTVGRDLGHIPSGTPNKENIPNYQDDSPPAIPDGTAAPFDTDPHQAATAANTPSTAHLDSDTTEQELPTEKTPPGTPQKKKKARPPRRRGLWALQRDGTARVVGFYDKGV